MKTGWTIEYVQNLPASTFQDVKDILLGVYDRTEEKPEQDFKILPKRESMEALLDAIKRQNGNTT